MAGDDQQNQLAQAWTSYLATRPLGVSFFGVTDRVTSNLIMILQTLAQRIQQETGKAINFTSGSKIVADPSAAQNALQVAKPKVEEPKPVEQTKEKTEEVIAPEGNTMVLAWKEYLKNKGMYTGDVASGETDQLFSQSMAQLDNALSSIIPTTKGMVWDGSSIGKDVTPQEYDEAMKLAADFKKNKTASKKQLLKRAQPTLDALGPPAETEDERPGATNFTINQDKMEGRSFHPWYSEHNGVQVNKLPGNGKKENMSDDVKPSNEDIIEANQGAVVENKETPAKGNIDDRMISLMNLIQESEKAS